jgi:SAM-dependent methyltransferase
VFYDGKKFPFEDKAFDYVICSHVLEHVPDPRLFLDEMFRVAHRGYLEYPLLAYDYLYNFDVHLNFLKWNKDRLYYMKKSETGLNEFKPVQQFFLKTLEHNYGDFLGKIPHCFFEGFEWEGRFELIPSSNLNDFVDPEANLISLETKTPPSVLNASKALLQALKNKFKHV